MSEYKHEIRGERFYFKHALGRSELHGDEFHDFDEIVFCLGKEVRLISKNIQLDLSYPCIIFIPREHFHHFIYGDEDNYRRCILQFKGRGELSKLVRDTLEGVKVVLSPSAHSVAIFEHLMRCAENGVSAADCDLLLSSAFSSLIMEERVFGGACVKSEPISPLTRLAIDYIDENFSSAIAISDIAKALNVSPSTLSHSFSRDLSISVYRYVTEKRLSAVRALLDEGVSIGEAARRNGFSDYSTLYRLYKKKYGITPSEGLYRGGDSTER
jgi:AraC-like DNA-binding protein